MLSNLENSHSGEFHTLKGQPGTGPPKRKPTSNEIPRKKYVMYMKLLSTLILGYKYTCFFI